MDIVRNKYAELQETFLSVTNDQALVVSALAVERLWQSFITGISQCPYYENERYDVIRLEEKCLEMIWKRIQYGLAQDNDWKTFCDLFDQIEELSAEVDLNTEAKSFYCVVVDFAGWCFRTHHSEKTENTRSDIAVCALEFIVDSLAVSSAVNDNQTQYQDILSQHPAVLAEIQRIDADVELAKGYPQNTDFILQRKNEYHALDLISELNR